MSQEQTPVQPNLPPGILASEQVIPAYTVDESVLPWVEDLYSFSIARCDVGDNTEFLLGSVIDSSKRLRQAAEGMTEHQRGITDNMFYSRIAGFIQGGQASNVDTLPSSATPFPIHVMRNQGGQRVYFGVPRLQLVEGEDPQPVVIRLAVCDKNKQVLVMRVLSGAKDGTQRKKMGKSK